MVSVSSSSAGAVATIKKDATTLGTVTLTSANTRYEFPYDYSYLEAGSWVLTLSISAGTGSAYVEASTEKPTYRTAGTVATYNLTANQFSAISSASSPTGTNVFVTTSAIPASIAATNFKSLTPSVVAYTTAGTGARNTPFINIGSWDAPMAVTLAGDHWVPIQVNIKNSGNVAFDVAAARLRVDTGATNALAAVGCLQLRQNLAHAVASSAILNASVNVSAAVTVGTGSLLGGYFSIEGSGQITKAGANDCSVLVAVNNNTNAAGTVDNVFVALQNGTGSTVSEVILVDVTHGTATKGISIENSAGTLTTGIGFANTIGTGINFAGTLTKGIDFSSSTMVQGVGSFILGYGDINTAKSLTPTASIVPVQVNIVSVADAGTSGDQTIGAAYFKTANTTAHQPNHQLATLMARASVGKNIWDAYALQSHLTIADDVSTTGDNAHLTAISGKAFLTGNKTVAKGWVNAGLFIIDGAAGATVTQMCHGVSIVSEVGVPNSVVQSMLHIDVGSTVNAAIQINGTANVTNLIDFNAQAGCLTADTGSPAAATIAKIQIDMNGTPGFIPVYADY